MTSSVTNADFDRILAGLSDVERTDLLPLGSGVDLEQLLARGSTVGWARLAVRGRWGRVAGLAIGAIEVGMCETVAIFRSMNGYSEVRIGGTGRRAARLRGPW